VLHKGLPTSTRPNLGDHEETGSISHGQVQHEVLNLTAVPLVQHKMAPVTVIAKDRLLDYLQFPYMSMPTAQAFKAEHLCQS
jgi:hypothetical protein